MICGRCGLPKFYGPAGYAGPQCQCALFSMPIVRTREEEIECLRAELEETKKEATCWKDLYEGTSAVRKAEFDQFEQALAGADEGRNYANELLTKLSAELEAVKKERDGLLKGCKVSVPTNTMEQALASEYRRGYRKAEEQLAACQKELSLEKQCYAEVQAEYDSLFHSHEEEKIAHDKTKADLEYFKDAYKGSNIDNEVLRKDAERYRWLRSKRRSTDELMCLVGFNDTDELDTAIDNAMKGQTT